MNPSRFERQAGLVPQECLAETAVTIIGVGAIGRQVALQLASLGVPRIELIDFDTVDAVNITTQGYRPADLVRYKVDALADELLQIEPELECSVVPDRHRARYKLAPVVFCCVDSIQARTAIWRSAGKKSDCFLDGRMLGETVRILTASDTSSRAHYAESLFPQQEAQQGTCTRRGAIYTAHLASALLVHQLVRWLRGQPLDCDLTFNLTASELTVQ